jgi:amino acid adenylation domain-containing protein
METACAHDSHTSGIGSAAKDCINVSTSSNRPITSSVHAMVTATAQATPDAIALEFEGRALTYGELDVWSNRLARILVAHGVRRDVLVGVLAERSLETVVSVLAVLKAGGAYVPLDPAHGETRINQILKEALPRVLLGTLPLFETISSATIITPSQALSPDISASPIGSDVEPCDLAYVIFTSGSTGRPKGVEIEHRSLLNLLQSMVREPGFGSSDTLLAVTTLAFDIAGLELYLPLIAGGRVVIAPSEKIGDGRLLMQLLERSGATVMQATPATWRLLFGSGWQGDRKLKVLVGGEALSPELGRRLISSCREVWNMYGPTETTIWSSTYRVTGLEDRSVPIGLPIANTTFYVLDSELHPLASEDEGELYIGGDGLARGYLGRPDLTSDRFVPDPFSSLPGARLYRTGDIARIRKDGNIEFLGRVDHQVKIRGFRIELGEIESVLERHPGVRQAIVMAREDGAHERYIVAYVSLNTAPAVTVAQLRRHTIGELPGYMVPSSFVQLAEFPLTANGKVDRKMLLPPSAAERTAGHDYVPPRNRTERRLIAIWEKVLKIHPIGSTASFFDLGGQSIQAAELFLRIRRTFGRDLPLSTLFRADTVEKLAVELSASSSDAYPTVVAIQPHGSRPPFFCVHGGAGITLYLQGLASRMDPEQPFYSIEPEGLDGKRFKRTTVETIAAHYVAEIRKIQPNGPYRIGGYCFGGIVAVEMAQQLRRAGEEPEVVALLSAQLLFNRPRPLLAPVSKSAKARLARLMQSPAKFWRRRVIWLNRSSQFKICHLFLSVGRRVPLKLRTFYVEQMLSRAEWQYVPRFYPGNLHIFRSRGVYDADPCLGWNGLSECVIQHVIGDAETSSRREIMMEPLVAPLAKELNFILGEKLSDRPPVPERKTSVMSA